LNHHPPRSGNSRDTETILLLANVDSALRSLKKADGADKSQSVFASLEAALHTYGSVKHLLPKLNLSATQRVAVEEQLRKLRNEILAHNL